jgi:hypothetical protein
MFIPGMHWEVHAKVIDFDPITQKGHVQFIGVYGRNADGTPHIREVESDPSYLTGGSYAVTRKLEYMEPQAVYYPDQWVIVLGIPKGPYGDENPHDLWAGIPPKPYDQVYYIIGALKYTPNLEHLDHEYALKVNGTATGFPPIKYTPLPHENPDIETT